MTENKTRAKRFFYSLNLRLMLVILGGVLVSVGVLALGRFLGNYYIRNYYIAESEREIREQRYINELREYVKINGISSDDTEKIAHWSQSKRYVYLLVYKNDELFFSSDMLPEKPVPDLPLGGGTATVPDDTEKPDGEKDEGVTGEGGGSFGGGLTVDYPTREELKKYAEENDLYDIEMADGVLFASVAEFTEYLYYDIANIVSLVAAMVVLSIILINYFRRIVARVKRLDRNVMVVAGGNIDHPIVTNEGYDELSRLSENVENMRCTILESIAEERRAREANTELITAMSHDIRTPLTVLLGYLDIMKSETKDESMLSYVEASEKTAMRLKGLSDDMFNYFLAFGSTEESVSKEEYDAATLFDQMLSEHLLLVEEKGYTVKLDRKNIDFAQGSTVKTDAPKLMRIIDNIFSNLVKYADASKPVFINVELASDMFTLEVKNTVRTDADEVESNGIGLKTCRRLAKFVADSFETEEEGGVFTARLKVGIIPPKSEG